MCRPGCEGQHREQALLLKQTVAPQPTSPAEADANPGRQQALRNFVHTENPIALTAADRDSEAKCLRP